MISERTSLLLQSSTRYSTRNAKEELSSIGRLSDRVSSLSTSADRWKTRVDREIDLDKCCPGKRSVHKSAKSSVHTTPVHIDQGLGSFFTPNPPNDVSITEVIDLDLDVIEPTEKLTMIRKTPVARPHKRLISRVGIQKEKKMANFDFVKPSLGGINDNVLVFSVSEDLNEPVAKSARDGLSAIEDYSQTKKSLRSPSTNTTSYPELLLIQVGGDAFIDVRMVVVSSMSVHDSACYLLITPTSLIIHNGKDSKVLERSKTMQVASSIVHTKQLNCGASKVERTCDNDSAKRRFWSNLKTEREDGSIVTGDDLIKRNRVFSVDTELEIRIETTGEIPCHSMLDSSRCLIFDFHSELYIWSGRDCKRSQTLAAEDYARQMQSQFSSFLVFRKISQGIPDILFSSKFTNWPSDSLETSRPQMRTPIKTDSKHKWKKSIENDASSIAYHLLRSEEKKDEIVIEDVALDGTDDNVITERKSMWKLEGDDLKVIENTNELRRDSCYVVRWQYRVERKVGRLNNRVTEEERETGRERIAYFYWLGSKSGVKEQGICALRLSEMDKTKSPHIRLEEGSEAAVFLSLFNGLFTVRDSDLNGNTLLVLSKSHNRSSFTQVESSPLRPHAVYIEQRDEWRIVAGMDSKLNDVRAGLRVFDGSPREADYIVQGDDTSIQWIDSCEKSQDFSLKMYRILGSESDIVQPQRPGTTFPYSQNCLDGSIVVDCGKKGWLWSDNSSPSLITLKVAMIIADVKGYEVEVICMSKEPAQFKALFPRWIDYEEGNQERTRKLEEMVVERMSLTPAQAIQRRNEHNEQFDIETIEQNLSEESFLALYGISRSHFEQLPQWKQLIVRKEKGYF